MSLERYYPDCQNLDCPLNDSCRRTATRVQRSYYQTEKDPVDVLIIGDCASSKEMLYQLSFLGPEKKLIQDAAADVIPDKSIGYAYIVRGWPAEARGKYSNNKAIKYMDEKELSWVRTIGLAAFPKRREVTTCCMPFILADIERLKPKLIIALGNVVKEALFPTETKSLIQLTNVYRSFNNIPVRFIPSHISVISNPSGQESWKKQLRACFLNKIATPDSAPGSTYLLKNYNEAIEYLDSLKEIENDISIDCETLNLNKKYGNKIATIQFSETDNGGIVLPYNHPESPFDPVEISKIKEKLFDVFKNPSKIKSWVGHNLKFECNIFHAIIGTPLVSAPLYDTMVGAFLLDENRRERAPDFRYGIYTLKQLAYEYVNWDGYDKGILKERKDGNLFDLALPDLAQYGAMDTYITRRLMHMQLDVAREQNYTKQLFNLMFYLYTPMILLFSDIEQNGFLVNRTNLRRLVSKESSLLKRIEEITNEFKASPEVHKANDLLLSKSVGSNVYPLGRKPWVFDISKGNHPQTLFFDVCGLPVNTIGKSGAPSVDAAWQENNKSHPLVKIYMEWSEMRHLYDTFANTLYNRIDPQKDDLDSKTDCRIRPDFNLTKAVTGRIACEKPNLQNIPRSDTPAKKEIKNVFCAEPGHYLVQLDYKANEVRWVGILAQDEKLAYAIWQGKKMMDEYRNNPTEELLLKADTYSDIHKQTASMIFCKPIEDVTKDERQISKSVIFAILYGSHVKSVAEARGKTVEEVERWFSQFYERFPQIAQWKKQTEVNAKRFSFVEAPHGRRRRFPIFDLFRNDSGVFADSAVPSEHIGKINASIRQSVNAPIQGIASDNGMCGASLFARFIRENNKPWVICNAVHDSCVFQVPFACLDESLEAAEYWFTTGVMEYMVDKFNINFNLPLEVDFEIGLKWGDMIKWNFSKVELGEIKRKLSANSSFG